jgi:hypothetical protein
LINPDLQTCGGGGELAYDALHQEGAVGRLDLNVSAQ